MSELVGLSLDQPASPLLSFADAPDERIDGRNGWGVAWYPDDELGAAVVRDPSTGQSGAVIDVLAGRGQLRTSLLVSHLRGAAKRASHRDTHPFVRPFAGRSWTIAHNGDLVGDFSTELPLPASPDLVPIGPTDTEHLFCWLLSHIASSGATTLEEFGFLRLAELLAQANELGSLNLVLSDGASLIGYRCASGFQPLYQARWVPPVTKELALDEAGVSLGLGGYRDGNCSLVVLSTLAFDRSRAEEIPAGGYAVAQGGLIVAAGPDATFASVGGGPLVVPSARMLSPRSSIRRLDVEHTTRYRYTSPVERSSHRFRLKPVHDRFQQVFAQGLSISVPGLRYDFEDVFGNEVVGLDLATPYDELVITATASVKVVAPVDRPDVLPRPQKLPIMWMPWQEHMMHSYLLPPELPESQLEELTEYARAFSVRNRFELMPTLDDITWTIYNDFSYKQGFTTVETTPYEVFQSRAGVCQDFANLMICLARMLNIPARYRVGYIYTGSNYDNTLQSDASHAWVEAYLPLMGWRGYDPTNGCRVGADHIRVAKGRNYRDATPTSGVIYQGDGRTETLTIDVKVTDTT